MNKSRTIPLLCVLAVTPVSLPASGRMSLPILLFPPLHYQRLGTLNEKGYLRRVQGKATERTLLLRWEREGLRLGAKALLLRPMCRAPSCLPFGPEEAIAIRTIAPLCTLPLQCWSIGDLLFSRRAWLRDYWKAWRIIRRRYAFGLSIAVPLAAHSLQAKRLSSITSRLLGPLWTGGRLVHFICPPRELDELPVLSTPVVVRLNRLGQMPVDLQGYERHIPATHLAVARYGRPPAFVDATLSLIRILRHLRFGNEFTRGISTELIMDWHMVPLRRGQPPPAGLICRYPAYPASYWRDGIAMTHLRWARYVFHEDGEREVILANPVPLRHRPRAH
jgi:hypothetical protein